MELDEINPAYVHPNGDDGESSESPDDERAPGENAFDRLWRSFLGTVMVNWFDRDARSFVFWFLLKHPMYRLPIDRGLTVRVIRGKKQEAVPFIDWDKVWVDGDVLFVRVKFTDALVGLFSGSLEDLQVVIERTGNVSKIRRTVRRVSSNGDLPPRKVKCRVISAGHAPPF